MVKYLYFLLMKNQNYDQNLKIEKKCLLILPNLYKMRPLSLVKAGPFVF